MADHARDRDRVSKYSKGMRQRLMMARVLVNTPDMMFLNEPTDGLDPVSSTAIRRLIAEEATRGAAILLTTHDMHEGPMSCPNASPSSTREPCTPSTRPRPLKLRHGSRSVRVREDGSLLEHRVALDDAGTAEELRAALSDRELVTVQTEEATLEAIFIEMTVRDLSG